MINRDFKKKISFQSLSKNSTSQIYNHPYIAVGFRRVSLHHSLILKERKKEKRKKKKKERKRRRRSENSLSSCQSSELGYSSTGLRATAPPGDHSIPPSVPPSVHPSIPGLRLAHTLWSHSATVWLTWLPLWSAGKLTTSTVFDFVMEVSEPTPQGGAAPQILHPGTSSRQHGVHLLFTVWTRRRLFYLIQLRNVCLKCSKRRNVRPGGCQCLQLSGDLTAPLESSI